MEKAVPFDPDEIIRRALEEDIGNGDITTESILSKDIVLEGAFIAKEKGVIAGLRVARKIFQFLDAKAQFESYVEDGNLVRPGDIFASIRGQGQALLGAERTALNFLQRMSGIATLSREFVKTVEGTKAIILDTRKTAPGLRMIDKEAVKLGGAANHRIGLFDMVLIKDNHIAAAGSITKAVDKVREAIGQGIDIEVEVRNFQELEEALSLKVDRIMLDNMSVEQMREAVKFTAGRVPLEASGNVDLHNVRKIAETGVDFISVGALTHSVQKLDISLMMKSC